GGGVRQSEGGRALGQRHVLSGVLALRVEEVGEHGPARQRAEGERPDEGARVLGQTDGHRRAQARQLTEQEHRLVGGDRARDTENQLAPVEPHDPQAFCVSSASLIRYSTLAAAISSSDELVGFLCLLSTRGGPPRFSCRALLAASTTSR